MNYREVRRLVADRLAAGTPANVTLLACAILLSRRNIEGDDAPFYTVCGYRQMVRMVKRCLGTGDLPGLPHLREAYPVKRGGSRVLVPVEMLTDEELESRAVEYETMAAGCLAHAKELRAYHRHRARAAQGVVARGV